MSNFCNFIIKLLIIINQSSINCYDTPIQLLIYVDYTIECTVTILIYILTILYNMSNYMYQLWHQSLFTNSRGIQASNSRKYVEVVKKYKKQGFSGDSFINYFLVTKICEVT